MNDSLNGTGARVAEGSRLLSGWSRERLAGSNPAPSVTSVLQASYREEDDACLTAAWTGARATRSQDAKRGVAPAAAQDATPSKAPGESKWPGGAAVAQSPNTHGSPLVGARGAQSVEPHRRGLRTPSPLAPTSGARAPQADGQQPRFGVGAARIRELLGIVYCPVCECDTMPLDPQGICAWCDTQLVPRKIRSDRDRDDLTGRFVESPLPDPPSVPKGCCLLCGELIPGPRAARYKKLYCSDKHRQLFWRRYTPKGKATQRRYDERKREARAA